jgi:hypothetical protein
MSGELVLWEGSVSTISDTPSRVKKSRATNNLFCRARFLAISAVSHALPVMSGSLSKLRRPPVEHSNRPQLRFFRFTRTAQAPVRRVSDHYFFGLEYSRPDENSSQPGCCRLGNAALTSCT